MTREEAIFQLMGLMPSKEKIVSSWTKEHLEALSMAIRALENNPWHKASEELPEDGMHILVAKPLFEGCAPSFDDAWYPAPDITDGMVYWMEIPELPNED